MAPSLPRFADSDFVSRRRAFRGDVLLRVELHIEVRVPGHDPRLKPVAPPVVIHFWWRFSRSNRCVLGGKHDDMETLIFCGPLEG